MKTYTLRFRVKDKDNFIRIANGRKVIETRAGSDRYFKVTAGDQLVIVCGKERITKVVKKVHHFKTIGALLKVLSFRKIMPGVATEAAARKQWNSYPGYKERIRAKGLIAWELK